MDNSIAQAVIPYDNAMTRYGMVKPLAGPTEAAAAISAYEALKAAVVRPDDVQKIQGRDFLKKSFWRRIATCFGLTLELVSEQRGFDEGGKLFYSVLYRAIAPNGRSMIGDGYCSTAESGRGGWPEHNVRATAHTRAKNRAISDLVGGGEVSAEEMPDDEPMPRPTPMKQRYATVPAVKQPLPELTVVPEEAGTDDGEYVPTEPTERDWKALKARCFKAKLATTVAQWEKLMEETGGSYEDTVAKVQRFEQRDLRDLGASAKGRH